MVDRTSSAREYPDHCPAPARSKGACSIIPPVSALPSFPSLPLSSPFPLIPSPFSCRSHPPFLPFPFRLQPFSFSHASFLIHLSPAFRAKVRRDAVGKCCGCGEDKTSTEEEEHDKHQSEELPIHYDLLIVDYRATRIFCMLGVLPTRHAVGRKLRS